jgi:chemotaxis family two-component system response regulator PixG
LHNQLRAAAQDLNIRESDRFECWDYQILTLLAKRQIARTKTIVGIMRGVVTEVLFEIVQATQLSQLGAVLAPQAATLDTLALYDLSSCLGARPSTSDTGIWPRSWTLDLLETLTATQESWEAWSQEGFSLCSPNLAPTIPDPAALQRAAPPKTHKLLVETLTGKRTLRDLAFLLKKDELQVARSLLPYLRKNLVRLVEIPDLPVPFRTAPEVTTTWQTQIHPASAPTRKGQVFVINDSGGSIDRLESWLKAEGYEVKWIAEVNRAIPILMQHHPQFVFVDVMMPIAKGYEVCAEIRRVAQFKHLPVVLVASHDGLLDRVQAQVVGATDFLTKPMEKERILALLARHGSSV